MSYENKSNAELINELQRLQESYDSLKKSFEATLSDHNKTEYDLKESEKHYRLLTENIKDVVWVLDAETLFFTYVSPSVERLRGYTPEEILAQPVTKALTPKAAEYVNGLIRDRMNDVRTGTKMPEFFTEEVEQPCKDGSTVWTEVITHYYINPANHRVEVLGVTRDITERRRAEEKLRDSESRFRRIYEEGPFGMVMVNSEFRFIHANAMFCHMVGYGENEIKAFTFKDITHPDDIGSDIHHIRSLINGQITIYKTEKRYLRKDGTIMWGSLTVTAFRNPEGQFLYNLAIVEDITRRKQTEEAFLKIKERHELAVRSSGIGIWDWEISSNKLIWDKQMYELYGVASENFTGVYEAWLNGLHPDERMLCDSLIQLALLGEKEYDTEFRVIWPDQSIHWLKAIGQVFYNETQTPIRMIGVNYDITEKKIAESKIKESENKYAILFGKASMPAMLSLFPDHTFADVNDAWANLFGFTKEELLGRNSLELGINKNLQTRAEVMDEIRQRKPVRNFEQTLYTKFGNPITVLTNVDVVTINGNDFALTSLQDITERKKAEEALRTSKAQLDAALSSMTDAVFISNAEGEFIEFNNAFANFHRFKSKEECGKRLADYPEILDVYKANGELASLENWAVPRALRGETVVNEEYSLRRKDTGETWIGSYSFSPIRNKEGEIVGAVVVARDVTAQRQIEKAQQEAEIKFSAVFNASPIAFAIYDMDGRMVETNPANVRLTGYSYEELIGKTTLELNLISPEDRQRMIDTINQTNGPLDNFETDMVRKDGKVRSLLVSSKIISLHGKPHRLGINVDITRRKEVETALKQNQENFSKAFMSSQAALLITRLSDGLFVEFNDAYCSLVGYAREELLGRLTTDFKIYVNATDRQTFINQLRTKGYVRDFETTILHRSGDIRYVVANQDFITFNNETCILTNLMDITTRKQSEIELYENQLLLKAQNEEYLAINEELQEKNQEYAALNEEYLAINEELKEKNHEYATLNEEYIIQNEELSKAKDNAEQSDRLKTAFLQNMSHEIRTPMNAIMGFSELLVDQYNNRPKLEQFSQIINQRCSDLLGIINEILDIAKIEAGQLPINLEHCHLEDLFSELSVFFNEVRKRQNKEHIEFRVNPDIDLNAVIQTDKVKLKQILINLIGNAFKFTSEGQITTGCKPGSNHDLVFFVSDTGIGIPPDKQEFIFERFAQLEQTPGFLYGGTGLGLSIVKGLVDLLGGRIWLESALNQGTTFYFSLPYETLGQLSQEHLLSQETGKYNFSDRTILIVEDDLYNADYLKEALNDTGIHIIHTFYGKEAIQISQSQELDIVLMDIRLPDIDGYKATRIIRRYKPGLKIIAQTAYAAQEDLEKSLMAGCDDYVSKPVKRELLLSMINKQLSR